jgi:hypothetical protein
MRQERRVHNTIRPRRPGSGSGASARRRAVRASEPVPGDQPDEVAINTAVLLGYAREVDNPLHLEWVVSRFLPCWGDEPGRFNMDYVESVTFGVIDNLEAEGDGAALAALRGLEALAGKRIAEESGAAADRLAASGVVAPPWAWQIGQAQAADARMTRSDEDDSVGVLIEYRYPDDSRHTLAAFVADYMGGAVKFMGLMNRIDEACEEGDLPLHPLPTGRARRLVREALEATDQVHARFEGDASMREFGALAWARVRA